MSTERDPDVIVADTLNLHRDQGTWGSYGDLVHRRRSCSCGWMFDYLGHKDQGYRRWTLHVGHAVVVELAKERT